MNVIIFPALTFEQIIKSFKGKYILGLSATPNRKDEFTTNFISTIR